MLVLRRLLLALAVAGAAFAATEAGRKATVYDGLVTLWVPDGWHDIPPKMLDFFSIRTAEATGGRVAESYQYGFRPGDPDLELSLPQVLIQVREDGRLSSGRFRHLPTPAEASESARGSLADLRGSLVRDARLTALSFDPDRFCLRVDSVLDLAIEGPIVVRSASFLTERGVFTLHCYELEDRAELTTPVFEKMIASVRFEDSLAYRPRLFDRWSSRHTALLLFAAAALLVGVAVVARRRIRSQSDH